MGLFDRLLEQRVFVAEVECSWITKSIDYISQGTFDFVLFSRVVFCSTGSLREFLFTHETYVEINTAKIFSAKTWLSRCCSWWAWLDLLTSCTWWKLLQFRVETPATSLENMRLRSSVQNLNGSAPLLYGWTNQIKNGVFHCTCGVHCWILLRIKDDWDIVFRATSSGHTITTLSGFRVAYGTLLQLHSSVGARKANLFLWCLNVARMVWARMVPTADRAVTLRIHNEILTGTSKYFTQSAKKGALCKWKQWRYTVKFREKLILYLGSIP